LSRARRVRLRSHLSSRSTARRVGATTRPREHQW